MSELFEAWAAQGLVWLPERGMGRYPVDDRGVYDRAYFEKYVGYSETDLGVELTDFRVRMVRSWSRPAGWTPGTVETVWRLLDIGIGAGSFLLEMREYGYPCTGVDVNPAGVEWLEAHGFDPPRPNERFPIVTLWDALEHLPDPELPFRLASDLVFVSLPLFEGPEHVLRSKHFRPDEHRWYWTRAGLIGFAAALGFECCEHNTAESLAGREDIHTFVFEERSAYERLRRSAGWIG